MTVFVLGLVFTRESSLSLESCAVGLPSFAFGPLCLLFLGLFHGRMPLYPTTSVRRDNAFVSACSASSPSSCLCTMLVLQFFAVVVAVMLLPVILTAGWVLICCRPVQCRVWQPLLFAAVVKVPIINKVGTPFFSNHSCSILGGITSDSFRGTQRLHA